MSGRKALYSHSHTRGTKTGQLPSAFPIDHVYYFSADITNKAELEAAKRDVADLLLAQVQPDDLLLLKASFGIGMDTLLAILQS